MLHVLDSELHVYRMADRLRMRLAHSQTQRSDTHRLKRSCFVFACTKFRDYVYGKSTIIETDHQPLVTILKKPIHTAPARLQRMTLRLQCYDITLMYKKGKHMYLAGTLSRAPNIRDIPPHAEDDTFEVMSSQLHLYWSSGGTQKANNRG